MLGGSVANVSEFEPGEELGIGYHLAVVEESRLRTTKSESRESTTTGHFACLLRQQMVSSASSQLITRMFAAIFELAWSHALSS